MEMRQLANHASCLGRTFSLDLDPQYTLALKVASLFSCFVGSANLIGGRGHTQECSSRTVQGMKFPNAPYSLKMVRGGKEFMEEEFRTFN